MDLSAYNDKTVRITDLNGDVFDGACLWNPNEYMFVEFGQDEEALQIDDWIFYKSDIADVRLLPEGAETLWYNRPMHKMSLASGPFRMVEDGEKTIELRLNDEKRQKLRVGDIIRFENAGDPDDAIHVRVVALYPFASFAELYRALPLEKCGYTPEQSAHASPEDMNIYYTEEEQRRRGVLGIEITNDFSE